MHGIGIGKKQQFSLCLAPKLVACPAFSVPSVWQGFALHDAHPAARLHDETPQQFRRGIG
jgi:hypothetical protein